MLPSPLPTGTIRQSDIPILMAAHRITQYPTVVRVRRSVLGGGFGDQQSNPYTWTVYFLVDGHWVALQSARGMQREWGSLDKLEIWLRRNGFAFFWVRNDIDILGEPSDESDGPSQ
ncbi:hypothetical protein CEP88_14345 [Roseobacter denitrificans]|uniref:Uncharacterized protein n=1 Tax=Roseobacter denitrificans (strain ATCC 33942 / OCh 114) TaxID=375451 RepID=Q16BX6_ROSDO|nr:hypothetical protein [Roseobacter denitrificans]ABG30517.1 hypothetical protein RD1_0844 [Roseobacter denitrificans OCh 114]AVL53669.1 hypothetical protein CEP88_14345 [Roseobacter denitrificans]SFF73695.1 hypothetical protein SAMN05443635_101549 [Roseobacter denitrificans OCh 114]